MTIGDRLREERERLGFSQSAFAGLAETTKKSQIDYEKGITFPKANYLEVIAKVGADIQFIVTGMRVANRLEPAEQLFLEKYRACTPQIQNVALRVLLGEQPTTQKFHGPVGQVSEGDAVFNQAVTFFDQSKK
ncbi:MAG TPA: helix-turn-helix transcriptional regulator [Cellvibrio sp.]|nr:helix-turn-helix transcriptional regulator [Cellvibrio sp.]